MPKPTSRLAPSPPAAGEWEEGPRDLVVMLDLVLRQLERQLEELPPRSAEVAVLQCSASALQRLVSDGNNSPAADCANVATESFGGNKGDAKISGDCNTMNSGADAVLLVTTPQKGGISVLESSQSPTSVEPLPDEVDPHVTEETRSKLMQLFTDLDGDGSGKVTGAELREALQSVNVPAARASVLMRIVDTDGSGDIDAEEWSHAIGRMRSKELIDISNKMATYRESIKLHSSERCERRPSRCMLRPHSKMRVIWDLMISLILFYLMSYMPFAAGFGHLLDTSTTAILDGIDRVIDAIFILDILLNFRTGYMDKRSDEEVMDAYRAGCHYFRTWFFIDTVSSIPYELLTAGSGGELTAVKVVKIGKVVRVLKVLKLANISSNGSALAASLEQLDEAFATGKVQTLQRRWTVLASMVCLCHWMACALPLSGPGFLEGYKDVAGSLKAEYIASLYWALTTLTTVGYGDITPGDSDMERLYCMLAMVIGGAFYGYLVGNISSIVANRDLNANAFEQRFDLVNAWMDHHHFPSELRTKIRRYFKTHLAEKSAYDEADMYDQLSPALRKDVGNFIIHEEVRANPLFDELPLDVVVRLQRILQKISVPSGQHVTCRGEAGVAMYIIESGSIVMDMCNKNGVQQFRELGQGDSFGEEIIFSLTDWYHYDTVTKSQTKLHTLTEDAFQDCFKHMPHAMEIMRQRAVELTRGLY